MVVFIKGWWEVLYDNLNSKNCSVADISSQYSVEFLRIASSIALEFQKQDWRYTSLPRKLLFNVKSTEMFFPVPKFVKLLKGFRYSSLVLHLIHFSCSKFKSGVWACDCFPFSGISSDF